MTTPLTLKEFLLTASEDHEQAVIEANEYQPLPYLWRIEGSIRKTQVETGLIINNTEARLRAMIAEDSGASAMQKDIAAKVIRAIEKLYHPEFYINLADPEVAQLFSAAHALGVLNLDEVTRVTQAAMYFPERPWGNVSLYDVLIARDACPVKEITTDNGWLTINTTADCPLHSPRVLGVSERTGKKQWISNFRDVSSAGVYETTVPREWFGSVILVEDPYGVL